jgi:hypothetical protein
MAEVKPLWVPLQIADIRTAPRCEERDDPRMCETVLAGIYGPQSKSMELLINLLNHIRKRANKY